MLQNIVFFTIVAKNYLAQAYVLGESVKRYHPESDFVILLMDDPQHIFAQEIETKGFLVCYLEQIAFENYRKLVFRYTIIEACTAVKPSIILHLLDQGADKVIYVDPDIMCYRAFDEVINLLDTYNFVITPHSLSTVDASDVITDQLFLSHGAYNLGFLGVARGDETNKAMKWWAENLSTCCMIDPAAGLFVDQKWFDLVPSYFDKVCILKSLAYNIAWWNIHERTLSNEGGVFHVIQSGEPVAFIHFSNIDVNNPTKISKKIPNDSKYYSRSDIAEPCVHYVNLLLSKDYLKYSSLEYDYATYSNGDFISPLERDLYSKYFSDKQELPDPFSNANGSFQEFSRSIKIGSELRSTDIAAGNGNTSRAGYVSSKNSIIKRLVTSVVRNATLMFGIKNMDRLSSVLTREIRQAECVFIDQKIKSFFK